MDKRTTDIVAYITWIGFLLAVILGDKESSKFHINQALVILLFSLLSIIPNIIRTRKAKQALLARGSKV